MKYKNLIQTLTFHFFNFRIICRPIDFKNLTINTFNDVILEHMYICIDETYQYRYPFTNYIQLLHFAHYHTYDYLRMHIHLFMMCVALWAQNEERQLGIVLTYYSNSEMKLGCQNIVRDTRLFCFVLTRDYCTNQINDSIYLDCGKKFKKCQQYKYHFKNDDRIPPPPTHTHEIHLHPLTWTRQYLIAQFIQTILFDRNWGSRKEMVVIRALPMINTA